MSTIAMRRTNPFLLTTLFAFASLVAVAAEPATAQELRFSTGNDVFTDKPADDDLYTFAVGLEVERGGYRTSFRENAFTDRDAGTRFDETSLTIGRALPVRRSWQTFAEAGVVRVGEGLFGQDVQNVVHRALGSDEVELPYEESHLYGRLALNTERSWGAGESLSLGPRLELDLIPGLRSHAVVGAQARWQPNALLGVQALVGARFSDASFAPLEPHVEPFAAVVRLGVTVHERIFVAWSYNDFGDGQAHLSLGYSFTNWRAGSEPEIRD